MNERTTYPAFYEETIRKLRAERQQAIDALRRARSDLSMVAYVEAIARIDSALLSLGEQP